jgi:hypothetical protein
MAIQANQIGNDPQSKLLWQISKQLEQLIGVASKIPSPSAQKTIEYITEGGSGDFTVIYSERFLGYEVSGSGAGIVVNIPQFTLNYGSYTSAIFPNIYDFDLIDVSNQPDLVTLSFPNLTSTPGFGTITIEAESLVDLTLGTIGVSKQFGDILCQASSPLSSESVNRILALLVSLDGTNGTTLWNGQVLLNAVGAEPPTGQGLLDVATLEARGATVGVN